jgi:Cu(I)/Ag(I) efflux system membrane fusion protein
LEALQAHAEKITTLTDVEEQRKQFDFLSEALIKAVKVFGIPKDTFYVQHCPMAFDNEGADWLSETVEIKNPYFGDKMLKCGTVKDTITKDFKNPPMEQASMARPSGHNH